MHYVDGQNYLKLNFYTTIYMLFNRNCDGYSTIRLKIKEQKIEKVDNGKLKYDYHVDYAKINIARKISVM